MKKLSLLLLNLLVSYTLLSQVGPPPVAEICDDGIDNDFDGFVDCYDRDCADNTICDGIFLGNDYFCQSPPNVNPNFAMELDWASGNQSIHHFGRMAIGDLNNDGVPEVVTYNAFAQMLFVLDGTDGSVNFSVNLSGNFRSNYNSDLAIANIDGDNCGEIFLFARSRNGGGYTLASFDCQLNMLWGVPLPSTINTIDLADFDGDGQVELYYKDEIRDARTGTRLVQGNSGNWENINAGPVAVDILGDATLEIVSGGTIYGVNLGARTTDAGNLTVLSTMPGGYFTKDFTFYGTNSSMTSVADYNGDGNLDVIASGATGSNSGTTTVFFWDVTNGTVRTYSDPLPMADYTNGWRHGTGRLNIADLDGDERLNVSYVSGRFLYALDENFNLLWKSTINEESSGFTGCTLFDFNGDGKSEIVYRDEQSLYIINGTDGTPYPGGTVPCISRTAIEYPIVADVDADGETELCVPCGTNNALSWANFDDLSYSVNSQVRVYKTSLEPWVPARRIWNQHAYFNVNINDDLTIPTNQQKHHLVFSNGNCTVGPNRPLNNFLNQSPYLDSNGCPTYASPDVAFADGHGHLVVDTPTCPDTDFTVSFRIANLGDISLSGDLPITFYDGDPRVAGAVKLNTVTVSLSDLGVGGTFNANNLLVTGPGSNFTLYIVLNDNGTTSPLSLPNTSFLECNYDNNILSTPINPLPFALTAEKVADNMVCDPSSPANGAARAYVLNGGVEETVGYTFNWFDGGVAAGAPDFVGANYANIPDGTYAVFATHSGALCNSDTVLVTIDLVPTTFDVTINLTNPYTNCNNPDGELTATVDGSDAGTAADDPNLYEYEWYQGDDVFTSPLIGISHIAGGLSGPQTYTLVTREKSSGCEVTTSFDINGIPQPVLSTSTVDANCSPANTGSASANVGGNTSDYTFEWSDGNSAKPTPDFIGATYNNLSGGSQYTVVAINNISQCVSDTVTVTIGQAPNPVITETVTDQTSCDLTNPNGGLSYTVGGTAVGYTFHTFAGFLIGVDEVTGSPAASVTGLATGFYTVVATNNTTGCTDVKIVQVGSNITNPVVTPAVDQHQTFCSPPNGQVSAQVGGTTTGFTFHWFDGNIGTPDISNPDFTGATYAGLSAGNYTVVAVDNNTSCASAPAVIEVLDNTVLPTVTAIPADNTACDPSLSNGTISANVGGITAGFTFHIYQGQNTNPANEVAGSPASTVTNLGNGIYTIEAIDNTTGCSNTTEASIATNITLPTLSATPTNVTICGPANGSITAGVSIGAPADYTFSWYNGNGIKAAPDYIETGNTLTGLSAGNYTVSAFNNVLGCTVDVPVTVAVSNDPSVAITITETARTLPGACGDTNGQLTVSASSPGNTSGFTFSWFQGNKQLGMTLIPAATTNNITGLVSGTYTVIAQDNDTGCQDSLSMDLPFSDEHSLINVSATPQILCSTPNGTIQATVSFGATAIGLGADQTWYRLDVYQNGVVVASQPGTEPGPTVFSGLEEGDYTIVAVETHPSLPGCGSAPVNITVDDNTAPPAITAALVDNKNCPGATNGNGSITLTIDGIPTPAAGYSYNWYVGQFTTDPPLPPANTPAGHTAINLTGGFYTVEVTNGVNGCASVETFQINDDPFIISIATADINITNQDDCGVTEGSATITDITVDGTAIGSTAGYTFNWYESDGTTLIAGAGTGPATAVLLASGTYFVSAISTSSNCQTSLTQFEILDVSEPPVVVMSMDAANTVCNLVNANGSLSASVTEGATTGVTAGYTFEWFTGQNNTNPGDALPPANITGVSGEIAQNLTPGFYTVRVTDTSTPNNNCLTVATIEVPDMPDIILIEPNVDLSITDPGNCNALVGSATINSVTVNGTKEPIAGFTFNWFSGQNTTNPADALSPANIAGVNNEAAFDLPTGFYTLEVISNASGCSAVTSFEIRDISVPPVITLVSATEPTQCRQPNNILGELSVTADGSTNTTDYTFNWFQGSDIIAGIPMPGNTPIISVLTAGDYTIQVINNATGCSSTETYTLGIVTLPVNLTASATPITNCNTDNGSVFATVTNSGSNNYTYNWYSGLDASGPIIFTGKTHDGLGLGFYTVQAVDIADPSCVSNTATVEITDAKVYPIVTTTQKSPVTNCDASIPNGVATASVNGSFVGYTFEWYQGPTATGTSFYQGSEVNGLGAGTYTVMATNINTGCSSTASVDITEEMPDIQSPDIETLSQMISCTSPNGMLAASIDGNTKDYIFNWYIGDVVTATPDHTGDIFDGLDVGTYTVTATNRYTGCISALATAEITEDLKYPDFYFEIGNATCEESNGFAKIVLTEEVDVESILWQTPQGELVSGPNLLDYPAGDYEVTVTSIYGCSTTKSVTILPEIVTYNGLSINGDNRNDTFEIGCIENYPDNSIKIFNRAGTLVYENNGYDNVEIVFDGTSNRGARIMGTTLPSGTYFYVIDKKDGSKPTSGYLELINGR